MRQTNNKQQATNYPNIEPLHIFGLIGFWFWFDLAFGNSTTWQWSAPTCKTMAISKLCTFFELGCAFWLNLANYKRNNYIINIVFLFLPTLQATLIELQSFHSICLKIGLKLKLPPCREFFKKLLNINSTFWWNWPKFKTWKKKN